MVYNIMYFIRLLREIGWCSFRLFLFFWLLYYLIIIRFHNCETLHQVAFFTYCMTLMNHSSLLKRWSLLKRCSLVKGWATCDWISWINSITTWLFSYKFVIRIIKNFVLNQHLFKTLIILILFFLFFLFSQFNSLSFLFRFS